MKGDKFVSRTCGLFEFVVRHEMEVKQISNGQQLHISLSQATSVIG